MADIDGLNAGLSLAGAVAPSVVGLISTLIQRFAADPAGTEAKVASVKDQIEALLGPNSASEGSLSVERAKAQDIARQILAAKLMQPPIFPPAAPPPVPQPA